MTPDRHSASKGMGITSWDDLQGRPVAARRSMGKLRVIVYAVPVGEPALKPAWKTLALAAGLNAHFTQGPDHSSIMIENNSFSRSVFPWRYSQPKRASSPVAVWYCARLAALGTE